MYCCNLSNFHKTSACIKGTPRGDELPGPYIFNYALGHYIYAWTSCTPWITLYMKFHYWFCCSVPLAAVFVSGLHINVKLLYKWIFFSNSVVTSSFGFYIWASYTLESLTKLLWIWIFTPGSLNYPWQPSHIKVPLPPPPSPLPSVVISKALNHSLTVGSLHTLHCMGHSLKLMVSWHRSQVDIDPEKWFCFPNRIRKILQEWFLCCYENDW